MIHLRKISALALVAVAMASAAARAQTSTWTIDPAHSSAEFKIRHLGVSNVRGTITGVKGAVTLDEKDIAKSSVAATLDTTTVNTANAQRDTHLKSDAFFDVAQFPTITFKSTAITRTGGKLKLVGEITLNGVTKPIALDLDGPAPPQTQKNGKVISGFTATGTLKRADFNFGPKFAPPMLGDEVTITIEVEIDKQ
jgi:polyisoprenoid-binding protein YceI